MEKPVWNKWQKLKLIAVEFQWVSYKGEGTPIRVSHNWGCWELNLGTEIFCKNKTLKKSIFSIKVAQMKHDNLM